ncbi:hypothetical protein [Undibacterium terreum]|uniref:Uncharacterized protein n=1 Tax=Undibacterium terreum TaxID=1224302 RepID=A0A916UBD4_9BURK|nr:hypothetical protein [Undibacterium terreum]GGC66814.1 hypothetical protein GCM10011396_12310 [Undibacterium terreum]
MQRLYTMFPSGSPGAGLILLRIAVAIHLIGGTKECDITLMSFWMAAFFCSLAALLVLGILTPLIAGLSAMDEFICLLTGGWSLFPLTAIAVICAVALMLLGPGAYSVDARLFGRRIVVLPPARDVDHS